MLAGYAPGLFERLQQDDSRTVDEDSDITPDELDGDEQIYELPWSMQQEIYYLLNERESKKGWMKALEGVRGLAKSVGKEMVVFEVLERVLGLR